MKTPLGTITTFAASIVVGCMAAVAIASAAAVSQAAPTLRSTPAKAVEVVRLEPVVVTVSKSTYDAIRLQDSELARANDARKVTRG